MATIIYPSPIFGPIHSRRLGVSLGVNLMPDDGKVCSFDCIYCECGFNKDFQPHHKRPTRQQVALALSKVLQERHAAGQPLDVITFAGNGEPTGHPDFLGIIEDTVRERNRFFPEAKVSVLSNATFIGKESVHQALMMVDNNILKLDTINPDYIRLVDRPVQPTYSVEQVIENMKRFQGHCIVQTMFMRGTTDGQSVDNTGEEFVAPWLEAVASIKPQQVMIYTIDRETPSHDLLKAEPAILDAIKARVEALGIECSASY